MAEILFPVGRMIGGSVYKSFPVLDNFKKPKLDKEGQPATEFNVGVAIPKGTETHWSQTPWGQQVLAVGAQAHPQQHNLPSYAWKIIDGDSTIPNKSGRAPASQEGYKGNWVIWFKQRWAPKLSHGQGEPLFEVDQILPGYYVEVYASVVGNGASPTPGVYLNPMAVNRVAFGDKISTAATVDTSAVGFGKSAQLPQGASSVPLSQGFVPPAVVTPQAVVTPNPAFLQVPAVVPAAVAPPPLPVARQMTAKANGATYESFIASGWTDALLVQHGYMVG